MNVRGIPTAAYQVFYLLPKMGYPPRRVPPCQGCPQPGLMGGYLRWGTPWYQYPRVRSDRGRGYLCMGTLPARSDGGTWGGVPPGQVGYPTGWTWLGYIPPSRPGWGTPSRRTTYAVGKNSNRYSPYLTFLPLSINGTVQGIPNLWRWHW